MKNPPLIVSLVLVLFFTFGCQNKAEKAELEKLRAQANVEEQNKALIKRLLDAWGKGDVDALKEIISPEFAWYSPSRTSTIRSREDALSLVRDIHAGLPDMSLNVEESYADRDRVIVRYIMRGTHEGELPGIPATRTKIETSGIIIFRIENGQVVEEREEADALGFLQQLGMELRTKAQAGGGSVEREIIALENRLSEAWVKRDAEAHARLLADDYISTNSYGDLMTKEQNTGQLRFNNNTTSLLGHDFRVRVYGDAAVVTFRLDYKNRVEGKESAGQDQITDVWVRRGGRWQLAAAHSSQLAQK